MHRLIGSRNGPNNVQTHCERTRDTGGEEVAREKQKARERERQREKEGYIENRIGEKRGR